MRGGSWIQDGRRYRRIVCVGMACMQEECE